MKNLKEKLLIEITSQLQNMQNNGDIYYINKEQLIFDVLVITDELLGSFNYDNDRTFCDIRPVVKEKLNTNFNEKALTKKSNFKDQELWENDFVKIHNTKSQETYYGFINEKHDDVYRIHDKYTPVSLSPLILEGNNEPYIKIERATNKEIRNFIKDLRKNQKGKAPLIYCINSSYRHLGLDNKIPIKDRMALQKILNYDGRGDFYDLKIVTKDDGYVTAKK